MNEKLIERNDRKLGHEWVEWSEENAQRFPEDTTANPTLWFAVMPATAVMLLGLFSLILVILSWVMPGLTLLILPPLKLLILLGVIFLSWCGLAFISYRVGHDYCLFLRLRRFSAAVTFLLGHVLHRLRVLSRDKLDNSYMQLLNRFEFLSKRAFKKTMGSCNLLVLLPRCIEKTIRQNIIERSRELNLAFAIAGDGATARNAVKRHSPRAIVAIACERDLITGIRDVKRDIPIFCINVKRPEGPCKNTIPDIEEFNHLLAKLNPAE